MKEEYNIVGDTKGDYPHKYKRPYWQRLALRKQKIQNFCIVEYDSRKGFRLLFFCALLEEESSKKNHKQ